MAQLNDLLVMGQSTLLGPAQVLNNFTVSGGTFTIKTGGSTRWSINSLGEAIIQNSITLKNYIQTTSAKNMLIVMDAYSGGQTCIINDKGDITITGALTIEKSQSTEINKIIFSTASANYISSLAGTIGFVCGTSIIKANSSLYITSTGIYPGATNKFACGSYDMHWQSAYSWRFLARSDVPTGEFYGFGTDNNTMLLIPESDNVINFGGSANPDGGYIFFGQQSRGSRDVPQMFVFGGTSGTAALKASKYYATSDSRLKENIKPFNYHYNICDLPIYTFDFIEGKKNVLGCMAQDLQKICPTIVEVDQNGYLAIEENKIIYLLLEEIKQLKKDISELKNS